MADMNAVIVPKSDQINADDLIGGPRTVRIAGVKVSPGTEQPVSIAIEGDAKVYRPCKSMARVMVAAWGADSSVYVGRSMTLFRDPKVKWGGMEVGGIRIGAMSDIDAAMTIALTETRAQRKPFTVKPLRTPGPAPAPQSASEAPPPPRQTAEDWLADYRTKISQAGDRMALAEVQQKASKALDRLATTRPDLHQLAVEAGTRRLAELSGPDDDDAPIDDDFPGDLPSDDRVPA